MRKKYVKRTMQTIQCEYCGKLIRTGEETRRFCNRKCYGKYRGEHPELTRRWTRSKGERTDTLCWTCKHTNQNECSWFREDAKPVSGWKAIERQMRYGMSYLVVECPNYEREERL